ncbi:oligopeptide ABC transporter oligopeptide-binding protein AliA [Streptococcus pneumoniae]|nr:oligopeptide ABC transporter oligopeptide-binding protein AliA [Streptococcus pneumoniae]
MKSSKLLALAGVTLLAATTLAACSGSGSSAKGEKTFSYIYETDPDNLNYLTTAKAATANITSNVVDGLLENDEKFKTTCPCGRDIIGGDYFSRMLWIRFKR